MSSAVKDLALLAARRLLHLATIAVTAGAAAALAAFLVAGQDTVCASTGMCKPVTIYREHPIKDWAPLEPADCGELLAENELPGLWQPRERNLAIAAEFGRAVQALNRTAQDHGDIRKERKERERLNHLFACRWWDPGPPPAA